MRWDPCVRETRKDFVAQIRRKRFFKKKVRKWFPWGNRATPLVVVLPTSGVAWLCRICSIFKSMIHQWLGLPGVFEYAFQNVDRAKSLSIFSAVS